MRGRWCIGRRRPPGWRPPKPRGSCGGRASCSGALRNSSTWSEPAAGGRRVYAERVAQGYFTDIRIDRDAIARYGLRIEDVQDVIQSALGGENVTETVERRERYPVNVRYARDFRESIPALQRVLVKAPGGANVPLGQLAHIELTTGPAMVRDEDAQLAGYVYVDTVTTDIGGYVDAAKAAMAK